MKNKKTKQKQKQKKQRITKIKSFINKYNWKEINFLSEKDDWKKFEKKTIALNVLYAKKEKLYHAYVSKQLKSWKTCLTLPNGEGWHYVTVKELRALLRGITFKHLGNFYCLDCLHLFATENKRKSHEKYVKML